MKRVQGTDEQGASGEAASTTSSAKEPRPLLSLDAAIFKSVRVLLQANLGEVVLSVDELMKLEAGSVLTLDRQMSELVDLTLDNAVIGRGEIVAVGDNFGVRIVEIADPA